MFIHMHNPAFAAFYGLLSIREIFNRRLEGDNTYHDTETWAIAQRYQYTYAFVSFFAHCLHLTSYYHAVVVANVSPHVRLAKCRTADLSLIPENRHTQPTHQQQEAQTINCR